MIHRCNSFISPKNYDIIGYITLFWRNVLKQIYIGHWNNSRNQYPEFPIPIVGDKKDSSENIEKVKRLIEKSQPTYCKGWSTCRCCGTSNGTVEYKYKVSANTFFIIPEGYVHYLENHNVQVDPRILELKV